MASSCYIASGKTLHITMMAIKQLVAVVVLASLLSLTNVDAKTECGSCSAANSVVTESPKGSTEALVTETIDTTVSPQPNGCDGNFVYGNTPYVIMTHKDIGKQIRCDVSTDGGRWIVIQRRISGVENFNRTWADYREGFGNLTDEFWLGNEAVYRLTNDASHEYELRIDFRDEEGKDWFATFKSFKLSDEHHKYRLRIGAYTGPLGIAYRYSLVYEGNAAFTTYDQDNDDWTQGNCAVKENGGWWFSGDDVWWFLSGSYCGRSQFNGIWGHDGVGGIYWIVERYSVFQRFTEMKIRPIN